MKVLKNFQIKDKFLNENDFVVYDEIEKFISKNNMNVWNCKEIMNVINEDKNLFYF